jgi:hypothetical protein
MSTYKAVNGSIIAFASSSSNRPGDIYIRPYIERAAKDGDSTALYFSPEETRRLAHFLLLAADAADSRLRVEPMGGDW